ncbi:carotenoid oxygenase family protein [Nostoc sp. FACHB-152]|uniref:carotenoid oxygenase family protein n=1 Tax=unclassified Nostoc TaxID=2593658 RepID=UPI00168854C5|nr:MULTISPECIES: carotenoid oxygenase family protein [unclassified Nostoc]MBD2449514.1 carotenoid oxygenase family protein [Nostoc sp. FACHB-152]MBD2470269.1 carotenoid oxygenase family protein [Nostoc sp. FACHB-145]
MEVNSTNPPKINIKNFKRSPQQNTNGWEAEIIEGTWPNNLSGCVFMVSPYHRKQDRHLFAGEGVIIKWNLKAQNDQITIHANKLITWDSFWQNKLPIYNLSKAFFPAVISPLGVSEIANTAVVKMDGRLLLTADAGRYWEADPDTLETITPIGYFDEHIISVPLAFFPLVANTAHPFYDPTINKLISCELRSRLRPGNLFTDMVSDVYITYWDGKGDLEHCKVTGAVLDGTPHTVIVTEKSILFPDMPFQMGVSMLLGLKIPPLKPYHKTQLYIVNREEIEKEQRENVTSRLITFEGDSYHFLWNYYHIDDRIHCIAIQQATISLTDALQQEDVKHFTGEPYDKDWWGIPWMFAFDPGVLRKVVIKDADCLSEEAFIHPGWFSTTLYTADSREFLTKEGYSAIYQVYTGYHRDFICRRHYLEFRDCPTRILKDEQLPQYDLPSVLAKVPLDKNWEQLTQKIKEEQEQNPDTHVSHLGKELLDFYVFPDGYVINSIQFIPQEHGYILTTILTPTDYLEAWLFAADTLSQGPITKLRLPKEVHFGFSLHSEYFEKVIPAKHSYKRSRLVSDLRSLTKVPYEFFFDSLENIRKKKSDH